MSSTEEGSGNVGAVSTDQTVINNNTNNDFVAIDMPCTDVAPSSSELANICSLFKALESDKTTRRGKPLIQKVSSTLRRNEDFKKYFKPKVISIGPLHHDDPTLHESKELKLKLAADFVSHLDVLKVYSNMKKEIDDLKKCYDPQELEKYSDDDEKLAWMFFVDGCAILQAVYMRYGDDDDFFHDYGQLFIKNDLLTFVYSDLFLLENQIPFRVLELLTSWSGGEQFMNAIIRFIDDTVITQAEDRFCSSEKWWERQKEGERIHLLHLLRVRLLFEKEKPRWWCLRLLFNKEKLWRWYLRLPFNKKKPWRWCLRLLFNKEKPKSFIEHGSSNEARAKRFHSHLIRNVKELKKVGIWLKASKTSCLTDISFNRIFFVGKLCLPPISVDDSTMNLIAYEMCPDFDDDFTVTSYMCFLDLLIDEAEDVKELRAAGILYNRLGSDAEVAKIFNKMNTDVVPRSMISSEVRRKIHNYCETARINHVAQAYHTYFSSIWTLLAFVGAITALLLGALQTYYTIHQRK
ncbi:hypothetical protein PVK06_041831 [Gossypium arboreum]|uniref:Uncharacterized protein n=1 Tax=Gossypium arboreum TaxID=29729 RepID=A0ABR0N9B4_GOSAR|nr:hypothetical protein PVK06_041831 [Gossypium arboreum]